MSQDIKLLLKRCSNLGSYTSDVISSETTSTASVKVKVSKCHRWRVEQNSLSSVAEPQILEKQEDLHVFQPENDLKEMEMAPTLLGLFDSTGSAAVSSSCVRQRASRGRNKEWRKARPLSVIGTSSAEQKIEENSMNFSQAKCREAVSEIPVPIMDQPFDASKLQRDCFVCLDINEVSRYFDPVDRVYRYIARHDCRAARLLKEKETRSSEHQQESISTATLDNSPENLSLKLVTSSPLNSDEPTVVATTVFLNSNSESYSNENLRSNLNESHATVSDPPQNVSNLRGPQGHTCELETTVAIQINDNLATDTVDNVVNVKPLETELCNEIVFEKNSALTESVVNVQESMLDLDNENVSDVVSSTLSDITCVQEKVTEVTLEISDTFSSFVAERFNYSSELTTNVSCSSCESETNEPSLHVSRRDTKPRFQVSKVSEVNENRILEVYPKTLSFKSEIESNDFQILEKSTLASKDEDECIIQTLKIGPSISQISKPMELQLASQLIETKSLPEIVPDDGLSAMRLSECVKDQISKAEVQSHNAVCVSKCITVNDDIAIQATKNESSVVITLTETEPNLHAVQTSTIETYPTNVSPENKQLRGIQIVETNFEKQKTISFDCGTDSQINLASHANETYMEQNSFSQSNVDETEAEIQLIQDLSIDIESISSKIKAGTEQSENSSPELLLDETHVIESRKFGLKMESKQTIFPCEANLVVSCESPQKNSAVAESDSVSETSEEEETEFITLEEEIRQLGLFDSSFKESDNSQLETEKVISGCSVARVTASCGAARNIEDEENQTASIKIENVKKKRKRQDIDTQKSSCTSNRKNTPMKTPAIKKTLINSLTNAVVKAGEDVDRLPETQESKILSHNGCLEQEVPAVRDSESANLTQSDFPSKICNQYVSDDKNVLVANHKQLSCVEKPALNVVDPVLPVCANSKQDVINLDKVNNSISNFNAVTRKIKKVTNKLSTKTKQLTSKASGQKLKPQKIILEPSSIFKKVEMNTKKGDNSFFVKEKSKNEKVAANQKKKTVPSLSKPFVSFIAKQTQALTSMDDHLTHDKTANLTVPRKFMWRKEVCAEIKSIKTDNAGLFASFNKSDDDTFTPSESLAKSSRKLLNNDLKKSKKQHLLNKNFMKSNGKELSDDLMKPSRKQLSNDLIEEQCVKSMGDSSSSIQKEFATHERTTNMHIKSESETQPTATDESLSVTIYTMEPDTNGSFELSMTSDISDSKAENSFVVANGSEEIRLDEMSDFEESRLDNIPLYEIQHSTDYLSPSVSRANAESQNVLENNLTDKIVSKSNLQKNYVLDDGKQAFSSKAQSATTINAIKPYECTLCSKQFAYKSSLTRHRKQYHTVVNLPTCCSSLCANNNKEYKIDLLCENKILSTSSVVKLEEDAKTPKSEQPMHFNEHVPLALHDQNTHCGLNFKKKSETRNITPKVPLSKPHASTLNHKSLQSRKVRHREEELTKTFHCAECSKMFNQKCNMSCHFKFAHLPFVRKRRKESKKEAFYTCHVCKLHFLSKRELSKHIRTCLKNVTKKVKGEALANAKANKTSKLSVIKSDVPSRSITIDNTAEESSKRELINCNNFVNTSVVVPSIITKNESKKSNKHIDISTKTSISNVSDEGLNESLKLNKESIERKSEPQVVPKNSQMVNSKNFSKSFPPLSDAENVIKYKNKNQLPCRKLKVKKHTQILCSTVRQYNKDNKYRNKNIRRISTKHMTLSQFKQDNQLKLFVCGMCQMTFELKNNFETHKKTSFHMTNLFRQRYALQKNKQFRTEKDFCSGNIEVEDSLNSFLIKCNICSKNFKTQDELTQHNCMEHPSHMTNENLLMKTESAPVKITPNSFYCSICKQTFQCFRDMSHHVSLCRNYKICYLECSNPPEQNVKQDVHMSTLPPSNVYNCDICNESFNIPFLLERHNVAYHNIRKQRTRCDIIVLDTDEDEGVVGLLDTKEDEDKTNTMSEVVTDKKPVSCFVDPNIVNQQLTQLVTTVHSKTINMNNICSLCNVNWNSFDSLVNHIMQVHAIKINYAYDLLSKTKSVTCDLCLRNFKFKCLLKKHITSEHQFSHEEIFICEICSYNTFMFYRLKKHMQAEHQVEIKDANPVITELQKKEFQKACKCGTCQAIYIGKSELKKHILSAHTPFPVRYCLHCHFSTLDVTKLKQHISAKHIIKKERKIVPKQVVYQKSKRPYQRIKERKYLFKCNSCDFTTKYRSHLGVHFKNKHPMFGITKFAKIVQGNETMYKCLEKDCNFMKNSLSGMKAHYVYVHIKSGNKWNHGCFYGTVICNKERSSSSEDAGRVEAKSDKEVSEKINSTTPTKNIELKVVLQRCTISHEQTKSKLTSTPSKSSYGENSICFRKDDSEKDLRSLQDNLYKCLFCSMVFSCDSEVSNHMESCNSTESKMKRVLDNIVDDSNELKKEKSNDTFEQHINIKSEEKNENADLLKKKLIPEKLSIKPQENIDDKSTVDTEIVIVPKPKNESNRLEEISMIENCEISTGDVSENIKLKTTSLDLLISEDKNLTLPVQVEVKSPKVKVTPKKESSTVPIEVQQNSLKETEEIAIHDKRVNKKLNTSRKLNQKLSLLSSRKSTKSRSKPAKESILSAAVVSNDEISNTHQNATEEKLPVSVAKIANEILEWSQESPLSCSNKHLERTKNDVECNKTNIINNRIVEIQLKVSRLKNLLLAPRPKKRLYNKSPKTSCANVVSRERNIINSDILNDNCKIKLRSSMDDLTEMPVLSQSKLKPETSPKIKNDKQKVDGIPESNLKSRKKIFIRYKKVPPNSENFAMLSVGTKKSKKLSREFSRPLEMKLNKNRLKARNKIIKNFKKNCKIVNETQCRSTRSQTKKLDPIGNVTVLQLAPTAVALKETVDSQQTIVPDNSVKLLKNVGRLCPNGSTKRVRGRPRKHFTRDDENTEDLIKSHAKEESEIKSSKIVTKPKAIRTLKNHMHVKSIKSSKIPAKTAVGAKPLTRLKQKNLICKKYKRFTRSQHRKHDNDLTVVTKNLNDNSNLDKLVDVDYTLTQLINRNILSEKAISKSETNSNSDALDTSPKKFKKLKQSHSKFPNEIKKVEELMLSTVKNLRSKSNTNLHDNQSAEAEQSVELSLSESKITQNASILSNHVLVPAEHEVNVLELESILRNTSNYLVTTGGKGNKKTNAIKKCHKKAKSNDSTSTGEKANKEINAVMRNGKQKIISIKTKVIAQSLQSDHNVNQVVERKKKCLYPMLASEHFDPSVPGCSWSNNFEMVPGKTDTPEISSCSKVPSGDNLYSDNVSNTINQPPLVLSHEKSIVSALQPTDQLSENIRIPSSIQICQENKPNISCNVVQPGDKYSTAILRTSFTDTQESPATNLSVLSAETSPKSNLESSFKLATIIQKTKSIKSNNICVSKSNKRPISEMPALLPVKVLKATSPKKSRSLHKSVRSNQQEVNTNVETMQIAVSPGQSIKKESIVSETASPTSTGICCEVCKNILSSPHGLRRHKKLVHKIITSKCYCKHCTFSCYCEKRFKKHLQVHLKQKPLIDPFNNIEPHVLHKVISTEQELASAAAIDEIQISAEYDSNKSLHNTSNIHVSTDVVANVNSDNLPYKNDFPVSFTRDNNLESVCEVSSKAQLIKYKGKTNELNSELNRICTFFTSTQECGSEDNKDENTISLIYTESELKFIEEQLKIVVMSEDEDSSLSLQQVLGNRSGQCSKLEASQQLLNVLLDEDSTSQVTAKLETLATQEQTLEKIQRETSGKCIKAIPELLRRTQSKKLPNEKVSTLPSNMLPLTKSSILRETLHKGKCNKSSDISLSKSKKRAHSDRPQESRTTLKSRNPKKSRSCSDAQNNNQETSSNAETVQIHIPSNQSNTEPQIEHMDSETTSRTSVGVCCEICKSTLGCVRSLRRHKKTVHKIITSKNYCKHCKFFCYSEKFFQKHLQTHMQKQIPVDTCNKIVEPSTLHNVISIAQEGASTSAKQSIIPSTQAKRIVQRQQSQNKYTCCMCLSSCKLKSSIQRHYRLSHNRRAFCCSQCHYCSFDEKTLQEHMLSHDTLLSRQAINKKEKNQGSLPKQHPLQTTTIVSNQSTGEANSSSQSETTKVTNKKHKSTVKCSNNEIQFSTEHPTDIEISSQKKKKTKSGNSKS